MADISPTAGADIYRQVGQGVTQPVNMLTQMAQTGQTANLLLGVQNQQRAIAARQAIGQNLQAATDPVTGQIDTGKLNILNSQTPAAAYGAQDSATTNQALAQAQQNRSIQGQAHVNQTLASLAVLPDSQMNGDTIKAAIDPLVKAGSMSAADEQAALAGLPPAGSPPAAYRQYVMQHTVANLGGQEALAAIYGTPGTMGDGQQVQPGMIGGVAGPNPGAFTPAGGATKMLLTPSQKAGDATIGVTPSGAPISGTVGQRLTILGIGDDGNPIAPPLGTGRLPPALLNPNRPGSTGAGSPGYAPAAPAAPAAPGQAAAASPASPGIVTGVGPAQTAALSAQGTSSNKAFQDISDQGVQARSHGAIIGNMLGDTQGFTSGQPALNAWKASLLKYAPETAGKLGVTPEQVASQESFDKWANQLATQQGAGTDARLEVSQHANPNSGMSQAGVDIVLRQLAGNADYQQARAKLAAGYGDQTDSRGFEAKVGSQLDPRAFQFDRMTTAQRQAYVNTLSPTDRASVQRSYNFAHQNHLLAAQAGTSGY